MGEFPKALTYREKIDIGIVCPAIVLCAAILQRRPTSTGEVISRVFHLGGGTPNMIREKIRTANRLAVKMRTSANSGVATNRPAVRFLSISRNFSWIF